MDRDEEAVLHLNEHLLLRLSLVFYLRYKSTSASKPERERDRGLKEAGNSPFVR